MAVANSGRPAEINIGQTWIPCRQDSKVTSTPAGDGGVSDADGIVVEDFVLADLTFSGASVEERQRLDPTSPGHYSSPR